MGIYISPAVWQYDAAQRLHGSQGKHPSAHQAPAEERRSCSRWLWLDVGRGGTVCFPHQLQPSIRRQSGSRQQTWRAPKDRPAGAERSGQVVPRHRPRWGHGEDGVCGFGRCGGWCRAGALSQRAEGKFITALFWDLTAALPVHRGGLHAHSHRGWGGQHHRYLWQLETGGPNNTAPFPQCICAPSLDLWGLSAPPDGSCLRDYSVLYTSIRHVDSSFKFHRDTFIICRLKPVTRQA